MKKVAAFSIFCLVAVASRAATDCTSCIIGGSLARNPAASGVSQAALTQFDAVGVFSAQSPELADFDAVSFCVDSSSGGNLISTSAAFTIIIR